jgi:hypothetical protein
MEDTGALRRPESWRVLFRSRLLVVFVAAAAIFHFANGPLLQLVAQKLALAHPGYETGLTSAAIIITQLATIPMALLVTRANALGRKPLLIIAFAVPLRGLLCASSDNPLGCSASNCSTAWGRVCTTCCYLSCSPISCAAPAVTASLGACSARSRESASKSRARSL